MNEAIDFMKKATQRKRVPFSDIEDETLRVLISEYGEDWKIIFKKFDEIFPGKRTCRQLQDRNANYLTSVNEQKNDFSKEEDEHLLENVQKFGPKFKNFEKKFPGKKSVNLKNRYNKITKLNNFNNKITKPNNSDNRTHLNDSTNNTLNNFFVLDNSDKQKNTSVITNLLFLNNLLNQGNLEEAKNYNNNLINNLSDISKKQDINSQLTQNIINENEQNNAPNKNLKISILPLPPLENNSKENNIPNLDFDNFNLQI